MKCIHIQPGLTMFCSKPPTTLSLFSKGEVFYILRECVWLISAARGVSVSYMRVIYVLDKPVELKISLNGWSIFDAKLG